MSTQFYKNLVNNLPDALIVSDLNGLIQIWNNRAAQILRIPAEQALGKSLDLIIPEQLRNNHWTGFHKAISENRLKLNNKVVRTKAICGDNTVVYLN
ncbi:MAG: PAS domain-containing protein, partial [Fluviibacter sp.]